MNKGSVNIKLMREANSKIFGFISLVLLLFLSSPAFSQKKVRVKNNISLEFPVFKDTLFRGYPNTVTVKGIDNLSAYVVEVNGCSVAIDAQKKNTLIIKASTAALTSTELILKKDDKEIYRHPLTVAVFKKEYTDRIKRNGK